MEMLSHLYGRKRANRSGKGKVMRGVVKISGLREASDGKWWKGN
jgi:hypothetical protein